MADPLAALAADEGLGAGLEAAWRDSLARACIVERLAGEPPILRAHAGDGCRYEFVHVPVRRIRTDTAALARIRLANADPEPFGLVFHEDGLITVGTIHEANMVGLTEDTSRAIAEALVAGGALERADVDSRQVQFIDPATRRRFEDSGESLYVRVRPGDPRDAVARALRDVPMTSAAEEAPDFDAVLDHVVGRLTRRSACNYCSAETLFPRQVTISTAHVRFLGGRHSNDVRTARDYRFCFTFAPFDIPTRAWHVLAWDDPQVSQRLVSMAPHGRSFSDLVRLVRVINRDVERHVGAFGPPRSPLAGVCNHGAGNTVLHQHYQFFRIPGLPLPLLCDCLLAAGLAPLARPRGVEVYRLGEQWPVPAYLIRTTREDVADEFCDVVDDVARAWGAVTDDASTWRTQNTWAWSNGSDVRAIFFPRDRRRVDARSPDGFDTWNAGVMEMLGWFVVDDRTVYDRIAALSAGERRALGDAWLTAFAPDDASIESFDEALRALP